jgi:fused signal recognition particle receptor
LGKEEGEAKKEEKENKEEEKKKETKKEEKPHPEKKESPEKKTEKKAEEKKPQETKKEEKAPTKEETKKAEDKPKEKKKGFLEKIFGSKEEKEKKREELEAKLFKEAEEEVKKEEIVEEVQKKPQKTEKIGIEQAVEKEEEKIIEEEAKEVKEQLQKKEEKSEEKIELGEEDEEIEELALQEEEPQREKPREIDIKSIEEEKRELKAKVGAVGGIKGLIFGGVEINKKQISDLLWELELSLIESDVEQDAARELVAQIKKRLVGMKVSSKNIDEYLKEQIKEILTEMMQTEEIDVLAKAKEKKKEGKPLKILMLGPNGAGKTTSIAKLVHYFKKHNLSAIVAAGDTFRAGAIDQIEEHAKRLNVRVIKQQYGADPAAVAFDAIRAAEAGKIDVILIDSAGRQETNKNLMEELRKIERVAKPDLKIFVGEAYAGQSLLEQVEEFKEIIGIDGFILTKIDTDAKGGTAISLLYKTKKPILFVGTGQEYDDFKEFTPKFVLERII